MKIKSSFSPITEHATMFLQEDTLEGFGLKTNSLPTKELAFEITSPNTEVEELILASDDDEEGVLAMMDERPKQSSNEFSWTLKMEQLLRRHPSKIRIFIH